MPGKQTSSPQLPQGDQVHVWQPCMVRCHAPGADSPNTAVCMPSLLLARAVYTSGATGVWRQAPVGAVLLGSIPPSQLVHSCRGSAAVARQALVRLPKLVAQWRDAQGTAQQRIQCKGAALPGVVRPQHNEDILDEHDQRHGPEDEPCHTQHVCLGGCVVECGLKGIQGGGPHVACTTQRAQKVW